MRDCDPDCHHLLEPLPRECPASDSPPRCRLQKKGHEEDLERAKKDIAESDKALKDKDEIIAKLEKDTNPNATHVPPPPPDYDAEAEEERDEM